MIFRHAIKGLVIPALLLCLVSGLCACGKPINEIEHIPSSAVSDLQAVQRINSKDVKTIIFNRASKDGSAQLEVKEQEAIDHFMKMIDELRLTEITHQSAAGNNLSVIIYTTDDIQRLTVEGDYLVFGKDCIICDNVDALKNAVDDAIRKKEAHRHPIK